MDNYISRAEHAEFVKRMEDEHTRMNKRFAMHEKTAEQMQELINNVGIMATNMKHMIEEQKSQGERLERLESVPANSWNSVKTTRMLMHSGCFYRQGQMCQKYSAVGHRDGSYVPGATEHPGRRDGRYGQQLPQRRLR
jgi:hypothetical protein